MENELLNNARNKICFLFGKLGSGKTYFVKKFSRFIKSEFIITSPTYCIVNFYEDSDYLIIHGDFYRLQDNLERANYIFQMVLNAKNNCKNKNCSVFIEWPTTNIHSYSELNIYF